MSTYPWKLVMYGLIILFGIVVAAPNVIPSSQAGHWPSWLPSKHVALGLDLKGGAHLVLEIDAAALREEILNTAIADARAALREAHAGGVSARIENDAVVFRGEPERISAAASALRATFGLSEPHATPLLFLEQPSASQLRFH